MSITYILTILVFLIILGIHIYVYETIESKQKSILKRRIISLESFIYNLQEGFHYRKSDGEKILNDPKWQIEKKEIFDEY